MISVAVTLLALVLGYLLTVGCSLLSIFGIGSASPSFVMQNQRIGTGYKRVHALVWMICAMIGTFAAVFAAAVGGVGVWVIAIPLGAALIGVLWVNTWESRQRGLAHQILLSMTTVIGVGTGAWLAVYVGKLR
jgi:hypothetical protein